VIAAICGCYLSEEGNVGVVKDDIEEKKKLRGK
jgi:hypothetical protein